MQYLAEVNKQGLVTIDIKHSNYYQSVLNGVMENTNLSDVTKLLLRMNLAGPDKFDISLLERLPNLTEIQLCGAGANPSDANRKLIDISFISKLPNLTSLNINGFENVTDISCIGKLSKLTSLNIWGLKNVTDISCIGKLLKLTSLDISGFEKVTDIACIGKLSKLTSLNISGFPKVTDIACIGKLSKLTSLNISVFKKVTDIACIGKLSKLTSLNIRAHPHDSNVTDIACIGMLLKLTSLEIHGLNEVTDISCIEKLSKLTSLALSTYFGELADISCIGKLASLTSLTLDSDNKVTDISCIGKLANLTSLNISGSRSNVTDISCIGNLANMASLKIKFLGEVTDISCIEKLSNLTSLHFQSLQEVTDISCVGELASLTSLKLWLRASDDVTDISFIGKLSKLTSLLLSGAYSHKHTGGVTDISCIGKLSKLTSLELGALNKVTDISCIEKLSKLTSLNISSSTRVTDMSFIGNLPSLTSLNMLAMSGGMGITKSLDFTPSNTDEVHPIEIITINDGYLEEITGLGYCTNLKQFNIRKSNLKEIDFSPSGNCNANFSLKNLTVPSNIEKINLSSLNGLARLTINSEHLQKIDLSGLKDLAILEILNWQAQGIDLSGLKGLLSLRIESTQLERIDLSDVTGLVRLNIANCSSISNIEGIAELKQLTHIDLHKCNSLPKETVLNIIRTHDNALIIKPPMDWIDCAACGGNTFNGTYSARYTALNWATRSASIEVPRDSDGEGLKELWGIMRERELSLKDYYPDDVFASDCYPEIYSLDIKCVQCQAPLDISPKNFQSYNTTIWNGADKTWNSLNISEGALEKEYLEKNTNGTTTACPCCFGAIELFGESLWVEHESGNASGNISFTDTTVTSLSPEDVMTLDATNPSSGHTDNKPAKLGFRVGLRCSDNECFEYKGIGSNKAFLVPLVQVATYRAAFLKLKGQPYLDYLKDYLEALNFTSRESKYFSKCMNNSSIVLNEDFWMKHGTSKYSFVMEAKDLLRKTIKRMSFRD
jgi:hypothetical protein